MKYVVTGAAGFIGFHVSDILLREGHNVVGLDNLSPYYDVRLKERRLEILRAHPEFKFHQVDLANTEAMAEVFTLVEPERVIHLAAQAGVRYSIENPHVYVSSNVVGFLNVLEQCRHHRVAHLVYASSSSVYGANTQMPFSVDQCVDRPLSIYAATKKSNELMAYTYSHLYNLPTTGLRFFTVYGPWGRPDMAVFLFADAILKGKAIRVFNHGNMSRDFTYVADIAQGVFNTSLRPPARDKGESGKSSASDGPPYRIYNIGNDSPVNLLYLIELIERALGRKAIKQLLPLQPGDVPSTWADISDLRADFGFAPTITIEEGIPRFIDWYRGYYGV